MSIKFPKAIGACIDAMYETRAKRLELQRQADAMKAIETQYEEHILNSFDKDELKGAKGDVATAGIIRKTVYEIKDWPTFTEYVSETKQWDLLQKRVGATACAERFANNEEVPGVEPFTKITLSLTKAGAK